LRASVQDGQVVIRPAADTAVSLAQGLARFDFVPYAALPFVPGIGCGLPCRLITR
jgi:hypothetical protein